MPIPQCDLTLGILERLSGMSFVRQMFQGSCKQGHTDATVHLHLHLAFSAGPMPCCIERHKCRGFRLSVESFVTSVM